MSESDHGQALAAVSRSEYRRRVLAALADAPATPSTLADDGQRGLGYDIAHVSRAIGELADMGLVDLQVPEETTRGRIYAATDDGERVLARAEEVAGDG